jgi:hypothetical protein
MKRRRRKMERVYKELEKAFILRSPAMKFIASSAHSPQASGLPELY